MTRPLHVEDRVLDEDGHAGTIRELDGERAFVLFDYQRPSSDPKPCQISELRFVCT